MNMNIFNQVQLKKPSTSNFDMTHDVKFSSRMGELTPVLCAEVLPGDRWKIGADSLIRFAPLIAPLMHRLDATIHYFYVPNRILFPEWQSFITNNEPIAHPYMDLTDGGLTAEQRRFLDYMGIPLPDGDFGTLRINPFPLAAYQAVYNQYYRDQNLVMDNDYTLVMGDNSGRADLLQMRLRAYEHDFFTASLPFAQKGADVDIPLGTVELREDWMDGTSTVGNPNFVQAGGAGLIANDEVATDGSGNIIPQAGGSKSAYNPDGTLEVGSTTIRSLRTAFRLQEWLEKMAVGGSRYIETLLSHWFVRSSDKRLQRPEYITGFLSCT